MDIAGGIRMTLDIPNYRVVEKLGTGAQTRIFRARCMRSGKDYAVKTVKILKPEDNTIVELMRVEYAIGAAIDSDYLRKVYELRMIRHRLRVRGPSCSWNTWTERRWGTRTSAGPWGKC